MCLLDCVAASLAIHVEDFCGGSINQCWAGFKLWMFVPPAVLESRRYLAAQLMGKQVPPEWLLAHKELLPHVQLALQLPGQLMFIKPVRRFVVNACVPADRVHIKKNCQLPGICRLLLNSRTCFPKGWA